jgi:AraC family transcriptional regulator
MQLQEQGSAKYGMDTVMASSAGAGWRSITVEHRRHLRREIPRFQPEHMEICIATECHPDCVVSRTGDSIRQHTNVEQGTIWFCPVGVLEEDIVISEWHDILHIYLPPTLFEQLSDTHGGASCRPEAVPYLGGFYNDQMRRIGNAMLVQLKAPTAAGKMLIDGLSLELTQQVVGNYTGACANHSGDGTVNVLDRRRLRRVLDYMTDHLEADVSLDDLANAACLSPFHFSRLFANTMGLPPHRYLSRMKLEHAKTLLSLGKVPLSQIALACCFSSQSNFTRAFHQATGVTPHAYRQACA